MTASHKRMPRGDVHAPFGWTVADATARAALVVGGADIGRLAKQTSDGTVWELVSIAPAVWKQWLTVAPGNSPVAITVNSNTSLTISVTGTDGVVRSTILTLA